MATTSTMRRVRSCRTCHFLAKTHVDRTGDSSIFSWSEEDRANGVVEEFYAAECAEGVWSTRIDPGLSIEKMLATNRKRDCFYINKHEGMSFPAARKLLEFQERNRRSRRERMTLWATIGAVLVALASAAISVVAFFED